MHPCQPIASASLGGLGRRAAVGIRPAPGNAPWAFLLPDAAAGAGTRHRTQFSAADKLIGDIFQPPLFVPADIGVGESVEKIDDRIGLGLVISGRQIDIVRDVLSQDFAGDFVSLDDTSFQGLGGGQANRC